MALDKVIDSGKLNAGMTATADAIRKKTGGADPIEWNEETGFESAVEGIQAGGSGDADKILDKSIESFQSNTLTKAAAYAFFGCNKLHTLNLPNIINAENWAFRNCSALTAVNFPEFVSSGMAESVFQGCKSMVSVRLPKFTDSSANHESFLRECFSLKNVDIPSAINLSRYMFQHDTSLEELVLPGFNGVVKTGALKNCTALKKIDFGGKADFTESGAFQSDAVLKTVILRGSTVSSLSNVNNFDGTPFASGGTGGTVYIPSALISEYQQATNWSTLYAAGTCNFVAIEGSEYE